MALIIFISSTYFILKWKDIVKSTLILKNIFFRLS